MALTTEGLHNVYKKISRHFSNNRIKTSLTKQGCKDVVKGLDDGFDSLKSQFNNFIPEPYRSEMSKKEKAFFFKTIFEELYEVE